MYFLSLKFISIHKFLIFPQCLKNLEEILSNMSPFLITSTLPGLFVSLVVFILKYDFVTVAVSVNQLTYTFYRFSTISVFEFIYHFISFNIFYKVTIIYEYYLQSLYTCTQPNSTIANIHTPSGNPTRNSQQIQVIICTQIRHSPLRKIN